MLAEEILRAELKKVFGDEIKIFRREIVATPPASMRMNDSTITDYEKEWWSMSARERFVMISTIIGPFELTYPNSKPKDNRRNLRRIDAEVRLFSTESGCLWWMPHYLKWYEIVNCGKEKTAGRCFWYRSGFCNRLRKEKRNENPCQDMVDSQTPANHPGLNHLA